MEIQDYILYEDDQILVLDKPAGIAVESASVTQPDLISMLQNRSREEGKMRPPASYYIVHRLDQVVGGVIVFAKTAGAAAALSKQLTDGTMKKIYRAKVCGPIPEENGELRDFLLKDGKNNISRVVTAPRQGSLPKGAKEAVLRYKKLSEDTLEIELLTGRHHQIRAQLSHAGMPIAGDRKYGAPAGSSGGLSRGSIALWAVQLTFVHPMTGGVMTFSKKETEV